MVAQEDRPLAGVRDGRGLLHDVDHRVTVFHLERHEQAGHHREVKRHVATVAVAEVGHHVLGPLASLGQEHRFGMLLLDVGAQFLQKGMRLGQVFAVGAFPLEQVRDRVQPQAVHAHVQPEVEHLEHGFLHRRIVEVQVGLVVEKPVPVVGVGDRVPRPVRRLEVLEDDPRVAVFVRRVAPDVEVAFNGTGRGAAGALEPGVLIAGVVDDQFRDDPQTARVRFLQEGLKIVQRAVAGVDIVIVRDVVAVVAQRTGIEGQQPDRRDAETLQIVELADESAEVADAIPVAVGERLDVGLIDDRVFVPEWGRHGKREGSETKEYDAAAAAARTEAHFTARPRRGAS